MKQLYITFLFLLYCTLTFAQNGFYEGYIIQSPDTLIGYVNYNGDSRSAQETTLKTTLAGDEKQYTPDDIAGYSFEKESKTFESKKLC